MVRDVYKTLGGSEYSASRMASGALSEIHVTGTSHQSPMPVPRTLEEAGNCPKHSWARLHSAPWLLAILPSHGGLSAWPALRPAAPGSLA